MIKISNCPLCGYASFWEIKDFDFKDRSEIFDFLDFPNRFSYWSICKQCGLLFQNPRAEPEKIIEVYQSGIYRQGKEYKESFFTDRMEKPQLHLKWALKNGLSNARKPVSSLDVGAGHGGAVKAFKDMGYNASGLEIDPSLCETAKERYEVELINSDFMTYDFPGNSFDIVYSSHVHEHLDDFRKVNQKIYSILKPGGFFICVVPTYKFAPSLARGFINVLHNTIFTDVSLRNMFVVDRFSVESIHIPIRRNISEVWGLARKLPGENGYRTLRKTSINKVKFDLYVLPHFFNAVYKSKYLLNSSLGKK